MRILHVLTSATRRGAEAGAVELHEALLRRGVESQAVSLGPSTHGRPLPVEVLGRWSLSPLTLRRLRSRARGVDVVVAHGSRSLPASVIGLYRTGVPFVYKNIGDTRYWSAAPGRRIRVGAGLRRAAAVVALTESARGALLSHHGLAPAEVVVIPSWRSGDRFRPATGETRRLARERLGIADDVGVCVYLGALASEKRVDLAIEVVARQPDAHLVLIGDGPQRTALEELGQRRLPGRVHFLGAVDNPESILVAADLLLLTSESEGVPGVVIEAGLCQVPSVAFDVGGVASVVLDGVTGRTVPFADVETMTRVVADVLHDPKTLGASAREHFLEKHDTDRVVELWLALLGRVAAPRPGASAGAAT